MSSLSLLPLRLTVTHTQVRPVVPAGFEPTLTDPESGVLPLHHGTIKNKDRVLLTPDPKRRWTPHGDTLTGHRLAFIVIKLIYTIIRIVCLRLL